MAWRHAVCAPKGAHTIHTVPCHLMPFPNMHVCVCRVCSIRAYPNAIDATRNVAAYFVCMAACFGLGGDPLNRRRPLDRCVEGWPVLDIHRVVRELENAHGGYQARLRAIGNLNLEIDNQAIVVGWHPTLPLRAVYCPRCREPKYRLHRVAGLWTCRLCAGLSYLSRCRVATVPGLPRLVWLRRRIKASPVPFSPIEAPSRSSRRYRAIVDEIRRIERGLISYVRDDVVAVVEKRNVRQTRRNRRST
jgi:hypothetical protein